jgi:murein endopeptidase
MPIGSYAKGCGAGMMELPETGDDLAGDAACRATATYGQPVTLCSS